MARQLENKRLEVVDNKKIYGYRGREDVMQLFSTHQRDFVWRNTSNTSAFLDKCGVPLPCAKDAILFIWNTYPEVTIYEFDTAVEFHMWAVNQLGGG